MVEERLKRFEVKSSKGISYLETGKGPAILLLHGIGASSACWLYQLESLAGFRLIAWDAPGYGASEPLRQEKPHPQDYAAALAAFVDRLLLKDVLIVGNSLGCLMAGAYMRDHADKVRGAILISPAGGRGGDDSVVRERMQAFDELGPQGLAEKRSPALLGSKGTAEALELLRWSQRRIRRDMYLQASWCLANGRLVDDARHFRKKVLVVCGSEDRITPEPGCKAVAAAFPNAEYRSLPQLGHCAQIEDPAGTNAMIAAFK
ncbi:MAG: alpha/beta fold hydrolase [Betaproteobacteria bacterium]